ncbi:uncharacterized protein J7T54_002070 [Emericellopsis cladophorae]|uniref:Uncharacterized protein n=1 Tax=Emericellopsis cladophorae TaxID=2686198 RepID=A0A9P9Y3X4_9HYPO|nr:uncharacterized protein J7T54_002070 [Emericellopsis cladophorae]KAI6782911.1 hypothetical protein J7T54_002070 [Emericellopsis cladophorae]
MLLPHARPLFYAYQIISNASHPPQWPSKSKTRTCAILACPPLWATRITSENTLQAIELARARDIDVVGSFPSDNASTLTSLSACTTDPGQIAMRLLCFDIAVTMAERRILKDSLAADTDPAVQSVLLKPPLQANTTVVDLLSRSCC